MRDRQGRERPSQAQTNRRDTRAWLLSGILVLGMVVAAVAGFLFVSQLLSASLAPGTASGLDNKSIGSESAPVTVVVYSDFQ